MMPFGLTIIGLAIVVAPGVLFVVSFFTFSIIKRTAISFGPAIDVAVFFSLSLLINALFGGFIAWLSLLLYDPCGQRLLPEINAVIGRLVIGTQAPGGCSTQSAAAFFYIYLSLLSLVSCLAGNRAVALVETLGLRFAHGVFTNVSSVARRHGVTTCSALCMFGGENSFVIYIGEVREIVLDNENAITHLAITKTRRALLRIGAGIAASDAEPIPFVGEDDEFIIPGASIRNVAFMHVALPGRFWRSFGRLVPALLLAVPIVFSARIYYDMANTAAPAMGKVAAPVSAPKG
ncbi:MAG: hypothetical protein HIU92_09780 [Proteobacteria bacterium]|nr:hypothetical protein [Pseudomonadota bacterium]